MFTRWVSIGFSLNFKGLTAVCEVKWLGAELNISVVVCICVSIYPNFPESQYNICWQESRKESLELGK